MKKFVKNSAVKVKNFVQEHKVATAVVVTSTLWMAVDITRAQSWNKFLTEKGLYDEFYQIGEFEELEAR